MLSQTGQTPPLSRNITTSLLSLSLSLSVMQPEPPFSDITIHLRQSIVPPGNSAPSTSAITVPLSTGVDLGLVGLVLGLDPSTLRLNGYYVSRSQPSYVSPGLLWGQLLEFFAQRGLPCGAGEGDAIVVQGKHMGSTDGNPFVKRKFQLATECPLKKRKAEIKYGSNKITCLSTKRSLQFQLETESSLKKGRLEVNHRSNRNASTKRSVNSDEASVTFKKGKIAYCNADMQRYHTVTSYLPIYLCLHASVSFCSSLPPNRIITVSLSSSVDIGLVGRVLSVDPKTVHLNGYYVSCVEPYYVSPGLSWASLLKFFARRRLSCGSEVQDAIIVQGKYLGATDQNLISKRKIEPEAECSLKKRKITNIKSSDSGIHHIKRIIKPDDIQDALKRMKMAYSTTCAQKSHTSMHASHVSNLAITV